MQAQTKAVSPTFSAPFTMDGTSGVTREQCLEVLEARRLQLCEELRDFPQPTAACDADCNTILAERAVIVSAISRLQELSRGETRIPHPRDDH